MTTVSERPIRPEQLLDLVSAPGHGGQAFFLGTVRSEHDGKEVSAMTYDAFQPLAEKTLADIAREAEQKWGAKVAAAHRLGTLFIGEASVGVAAGAPHREEAFAACRYVIEEVKRRLPVWKKEVYADGSARWLDGCALAAPR